MRSDHDAQPAGSPALGSRARRALAAGLPATKPRRKSTPLAALLAAAGLVLLVCATPAGAATGGLAWSRVYDSPSHSDDGFVNAAAAPKGGVYVDGVTNGPADDILVARYAASGKRLWLRTYNGPGNLGDHPSASAVDAHGNLVVVGLANGANIVVLKYTPAGHRLWARVYDDPSSSNEYGSSVAIDAAGDIYVAGGAIGATEQIILAKYSPAGVRLWVRHYTGGGVGSVVTDIALDRAGNVYLTGDHTAIATSDVLTLKYSRAGVRRWARVWGGAAGGEDYGAALAVGRAGVVYVVGATTGTSTDTDALALKYNTSGALRWSRIKTSAGALPDGYADVALLGNGDVVAVGTTATNGNDVLVVRLTPGGATRWGRTYDDAQHKTDTAARVAVSRAGAIYVAGETYDAATSWNILTVKFAGAGVFDWAKSYVGAGNFDQQAFDSLAFNGGVYVAGSQEGVSSDGVLIRYKP